MKRGRNIGVSLENPTAHAEIIMDEAVKKANKLNDDRPNETRADKIAPLPPQETPKPEPVYSGEDLREIGRRYDAEEKIIKAAKREHIILGTVVSIFLLLLAAGLILQAYDYISNLPIQAPETPAPTASIEPTKRPSSPTATPTRFSATQRGNELIVIPANSVPLVTRQPNGDRIIFAATFTPTPEN